MKTTVFYHSADFDGIFCREIARKFLPDSELIGWNFGDAPLEIPSGPIYVMDLPIDRVFGFDYSKVGNERGPQHPPGLVWIDHHKSSIESHPKDIPGYRIDGVAACRLAWQWFLLKSGGIRNPYPTSEFPTDFDSPLPFKEQFIEREVSEPLAVRLAGEYDIWDKRDPRAELFQHGLRSRELGPDTWDILLSGPTEPEDGQQGLAEIYVDALLDAGEAIAFARANEYRDVITSQGFDIQFEGLTFLACCSHEADIRSHLFAAGIKPHHDALFGFTFTGIAWRVSLYHAPGKEHHDLSLIAKKYGGGGHRGACGFIAPELASILGSSHF